MIDVLIVTALKEEFDAVRAVARGAINDWQEHRDHAGFTYLTRDYTGVSGPFKVGLVRAVSMGGFAAGQVATRLVRELDPRCLAMCGICAGRRSQVFLGDVVVADRVYQYDTGKLYADGTMLQDITTYNLDPRWKQAAEHFTLPDVDRLQGARPLSLEQQQHWLLGILYDEEEPLRHPLRTSACPDWTRVVKRLKEKRFVTATGLGLTKKGRNYFENQCLLFPDGFPPDPPFRVHVGPMAAGNKVVEDDAIFDRLAKSERKILALEMEGAAIGMVAEMQRVPHLLIAKGVCDYADSDKDDRYHAFAALASAEFTLAFLRDQLSSRSQDQAPDRKSRSESRPSAPVEPFKLVRLQLENFKCFERLDLQLGGPSILKGTWNCIAGINGAGKSSVLQAICLLLLGERAALELGANRLAQMRRKEGELDKPAKLVATLGRSGGNQDVMLYLDGRDIDLKRLSNEPDYVQMKWAWEDLDKMLILAYGPSRNISTYRDTRFEHLSRRVRHLMTLFDPFTHLEEIDALLEETDEGHQVLPMLKKIIDHLLEEKQIRTRIEKKSLVFEMEGAILRAVDLPDGFRSLFSWLADLCGAWCRRFPESHDPSEIQAIVMVDEIDHHLHASLQRLVVPRLRECLPQVQWIVTTHSPLVVSSFDRNELILLDNRNQDGVRLLDRQIMGFSIEEIYRWLMGTSPTSAYVEEKLRQADRTEPDDLDETMLGLLLDQSPECNEQEALEKAAWRKKMLDKLGL